ncbi:calcium-activated chloride channel regulator 1 [Eurytemora carolleeae]|uniref:calcium-activated chloride channel regulator 1 n=1 Tax=Eurytemora carolleeae TaxID=1294199 RepID=UPI000C792E05|nr:calcium-activated chloride channel regulator 1 [Eurytemora carolleeae]|eukprot:XP_023344493.1 calcium-activated chloride channel regulator 1-like [Eurytemora affinis]
MAVVLEIKDITKVESFEVIDPAGNQNSFAKFQDGLVYFKFPGESLTGVWTYKVKMYSDAIIPSQGFTVDVTITETDEDAVIALATTNKINTVVKEISEKIIISTSLFRGTVPIIGASVECRVQGPGGFVSMFPLKDSGQGFPDITAQDGIYSGYLKQFATSPGTYSIGITVTDNNGNASLEKTRGDSPIIGSIL